jgi:hypothetical protein
LRGRLTTVTLFLSESIEFCFMTTHYVRFSCTNGRTYTKSTNLKLRPY